MLSAAGQLQVHPNYAIRIILSRDFCNYYKWLILKQFPNHTRDLQTPKHGCHITVTNHKLHHNINYSLAYGYVDKKFVFEYDNNIRIGGKTKNFVNFYMPVKCELADKLKDELGIKDSPNYLGLHLTICNNKNTK